MSFHLRLFECALILLAVAGLRLDKTRRTKPTGRLAVLRPQCMPDCPLRSWPTSSIGVVRYPSFGLTRCPGMSSQGTFGRLVSSTGLFYAPSTASREYLSTRQVRPIRLQSLRSVPTRTSCKASAQTDRLFASDRVASAESYADYNGTVELSLHSSIRRH